MPETPAPTPTAEQTGTTLQDRINILTRKRHDAERAAESLTQEIASRDQTIANLQHQLSQLQRPVQQSLETPAQYGSPAGQVNTPATQQLDPAQLQAMVASAVQNALQPVTQSLQAQRRSSEHTRAFAETARELPALNDVNSDLFKTFSEVWEKRPDLQKLDDGVTIAAYVAQGIVNAQPASRQADTRAAAAIDAPRGTPQNLLPDTDDGRAQAKQLAAKLQEQGEKGGLDTGGWEALLSAQLASATPE